MDQGDKSMEQLQQLARTVSDRLQADILIYIGDIAYGYDRQLMDLCLAGATRPNVFLILTSFGGSADAAYRMARCLQRRYKKVIICIRSFCKSAGTLLALGAHEIVMSDHSELGPLDVQVFKPDELGEMSSGLTLTEAMSSLQSLSFGYWEEQFLAVRRNSGLQISTRSASQIATEMMVGVFAPIYQQIDPMRLGELQRATRISVEYGQRLQKNLRPGALIRLVSDYPSHEFVIDKDEAKTLFRAVRDPTSEEKELLDIIEDDLQIFDEISLDENGPFIGSFDDFLNIVYSGEEKENGEPDNGTGGEATTPEESGGGDSDGANSSGAEEAPQGNNAPGETRLHARKVRSRS